MENVPLTTDSDHLPSSNTNYPADFDRKQVEQDFFDRDRRDKANRRRREMIEILGGIKPFEEYTIEKFRPDEAAIAFQQAVRFSPEKDNLFFYGPNTVGKTHLATAIARKYLELGMDVRFFYVPTLIRDFRIRSGKADFESEKKWINKLVKAQVLGMDELGQGTVTEYVVDIISEILDGRIRDGRNGLIVTSNFPPKDIHHKFGGKVFSRITRLCNNSQIIFFPPGVPR